MKPSCASLVALLVCSLGALTARADTFNFSFGTSADMFSGSGTLTGTLQSPGEYLITGITGTTDTGNGKQRPIDSLIEPDGFILNDNLLFVSSSGVGTFDSYGLSYLLNNGAQVNIYTDIFGDTEVLERVNGDIAFETVPYSVTTTPEPGSFLLLGTGLLGAVGAARRKFAA